MQTEDDRRGESEKCLPGGEISREHRIRYKEAYGNLTEETWETIATLTDWPGLLKKKKRYQKTEEEGKGYDMDSAWKEILADERARGREEGREEGKTSIIQNMINRNFSDKDIRAAVKCRQKTIDEVRKKNACKTAE